jgi:hypothetical protein
LTIRDSFIKGVGSAYFDYPLTKPPLEERTGITRELFKLVDEGNRSWLEPLLNVLLAKPVTTVKSERNFSSLQHLLTIHRLAMSPQIAAAYMVANLCEPWVTIPRPSETKPLRQTTMLELFKAQKDRIARGDAESSTPPHAPAIAPVPKTKSSTSTVVDVADSESSESDDEEASRKKRKKITADVPRRSGRKLKLNKLVQAFVNIQADTEDAYHGDEYDDEKEEKQMVCSILNRRFRMDSTDSESDSDNDRDKDESDCNED